MRAGMPRFRGRKRSGATADSPRSPLARGLAMHHAGRSKIFERSADRLEQRDLLRTCSSVFLAAAKLGELGPHIGPVQYARFDWLDDVSAFGERADVGVDEDR